MIGQKWVVRLHERSPEERHLPEMHLFRRARRGGWGSGLGRCRVEQRARRVAAPGPGSQVHAQVEVAVDDAEVTGARHGVRLAPTAPQASASSHVREGLEL
jgi:hypothetical protein